ncbi:MAG: SUMF1/EgtB/PvdO family nonheme iron enzyme, partial [bacterium]|nr:SUMF1/EgtB/PvdO family nonheme iron enzyme [bacterium]
NSITEPPYWTSDRYNSGIAFPNHPVVGISWYEAYAFCNWVGGHLPTEAQWEKAARSTDGRTYPWGNTWDASKCNSAYNIAPDTFAYSSPVGFFPAGASYYGVYDMAGNVWEWVNDWYGSTYYSDPDATSNPAGPTTGIWLVFRGGSFYYGPADCRSANRHVSFIPGYSGFNYGFRPAK